MKNINFFEGMHVFKSDEKVTDELTNLGNLFLIQFTAIVILIHGDQKPLIFRATSQWFISMDRNNLRKSFKSN